MRRQIRFVVVSLCVGFMEPLALPLREQVGDINDYRPDGRSWRW